LPAIAIGIYTFFEFPENPVAAAEARGCDGFGVAFRRSASPKRSCGPHRSLVPRQRLQKVRHLGNCVDTYAAMAVYQAKNRYLITPFVTRIEKGGTCEGTALFAVARF